MSELVCLELSILLWYAHVFTHGAFAGGALSLPYVSGPRDDRREPKVLLFPRRVTRSWGCASQSGVNSIVRCRYR
jgi:hypothetical protein